MDHQSRDTATPSSNSDIHQSSGHQASSLDRNMLQEYGGGDGQFQDQYSMLGHFPGYPSLPESMSMWAESNNIMPVTSGSDHALGLDDGSNLFTGVAMPAAPQWNTQDHSHSSHHLMNDFNGHSSSSLSFPQELDPVFQSMGSSQYQNVTFVPQNPSGEQSSMSAGSRTSSSQNNTQSSTAVADAKVNSDSPWGASMASPSPSAFQVHGITPHMANQPYQAPSKTSLSVENKPVPQSLPTTTVGSGNTAPSFLQMPDLPPYSPARGSFRVIDSKALSKSISGLRPINNLVAIGTMELEMPQVKASPVSLIPKIEERMSINQLQKLAVKDGESKLKLDRVQKKRDPTRSRSVSSATSGPRTSPSTSGSESESESDPDTSDGEDIEDFPLPVSRPSDPLKAVEYDVIKAVWHSKSKYLENEVLFSHISQFSDLFLKLRDDWKKANELLKAAIEGKSTQMESLKQNVTNQRNILEAAVKAAIEFGHPEILQTLGQNPRLLASMQPILLDRAKESDHNGSLSISIFKLLALFKGVTTEALEMTKLTKILSAFSKKGNEEVKNLVKTITDKAASAKEAKSPPASGNDLKPKKAVVKPAEVKTVPAKTPASPKAGDSSKATSSLTEPKSKTDPKGSDVSTGQKRSRPAEPATNSNVKRVNTGQASVSGPKTTSSTTPSTTPSVTAKKSVTTFGSKSSANASPPAPSTTKAKAVVTAPKSSSSFFSSMQSAVKKAPATEKASSTSTTSATTSTASAPANPAFSFGGILEDLLNPKEREARSKEQAAKSEETEEEKTKRVKKEARRKLRVSWKEDGDLVAIRYFHHDPEEDTGHDANLVQDVGDVRNEGLMFKQLHKDHFDLDAEEEEKEEAFGSSDYRSPSEVDVSDDIDSSDVEKFYIRFAGGKKQPNSEDCKIQEDREASTLMEIYYSRDDIPPRPKSPAEPYTYDEHPTVPFGNPDEKTMARSNALLQASIPVVDPALTNVRDLLKALGGPASDQTPQSSAAPPQSVATSQPQSGADDSGLFNLESIFAQFANPQNQASQPAPTPAPIYPPFSVQPAVTSEAPVNPLVAFAGLFPPPPPPFQSQPVIPPPTSDLSSIIAALSQHNQPVAQQQEYVPPAAGATFTPQSAPPPDPSALLASLGPLFAAMPGYVPASPVAAPNQAQSYETGDRKRGREEEDHDGFSSKRQNSANSNGRGGFQAKKWQGSVSTSNKPKFIESKKYSQPCKFWPLGKCMKGAECTYRHDPL